MKNEKILLKEDFIENALMIAGFIPVIGEIADIILIIRYLFQGKYLYAGLMLIALIPTVGDFIAKPFIYFLKGRKVTNLALKNSDELLKYLEKTPEAKKMYMKFGNHINNPLIGKTINQIEKVPTIGGKIAGGMRKSIKEHANVLERIFKRPIDISKSIGAEIKTNKASLLKTVAGKGPVAMGIKNHFRGERLAKYIEKNGREPSNWLSNWWNVVYKGRRDRKAYVKKFIMANNLLRFFNLPSFSDFEKKFETDADFRTQLANNPKFTDMIGEYTDSSDLDIINSQSIKQPEKSGGFGRFLGLGFLKNIAQSL
jgi:hypothetical protein